MIVHSSRAGGERLLTSTGSHYFHNWTFMETNRIEIIFPLKDTIFCDNFLTKYARIQGMHN